MKFEKFTPIAPTEEQKSYEELAKKEASNSNSIFDKIVSSITGKGFDKEDIMRVDANTENELRDKIRQGKTVGGHQGYMDANEKLEKIKNSTLEYSESPIIGSYGFLKGYHSILSGKIKGHDVVLNRIEREPTEADDIKDRSPRINSCSGTIDGIELSQEEAMAIYNEYINIASDRTKEMYSAKHKSEIEKQKIAKEKKEKAETETKEKADDKVKEDAIVKANAKAKNDSEKAILLKDLGL